MIYAVTGADSGAFKATDYVVKYVAGVGGVSHLSLVESEGALLWWNHEGIYALNPDSTGFSFTINNISKQTIQSIINVIPIANRSYVKGAYNKREQVIRWIFSDDDDLTYYRYNRMLDFNVVSKAFYTHTITPGLSPRVRGLIALEGFVEVATLEDVYDEDDELVLDGDDEVVQTASTLLVPQQEIFKFAIGGAIGTADANGFTYGELRNTDYVDWYTRNSVGVAYIAYGVSGYRIRGEMLRSFNATPTAFVVRNVDDGSLKISAVWDYGQRESVPVELYRDEAGDYIIRRVKLRGKGKALQIKFVSSEGQPFELVGWATFDTGGTQP
jgi:hypothetical protein